MANCFGIVAIVGNIATLMAHFGGMNHTAIAAQDRVTGKRRDDIQLGCASPQ